ncbi:hypothetical protein GCM10027066_16850 [Dyella jejuensis]
MHAVREFEVLHALDAQILVGGAVERHRPFVEKYFSHVTYLCPAVPGPPPRLPLPNPASGLQMNSHYISAGFPGRISPALAFEAPADCFCMRFAIDLVYAAEKPSTVA